MQGLTGLATIEEPVSREEAGHTRSQGVRSTAYCSNHFDRLWHGRRTCCQRRLRRLH